MIIRDATSQDAAAIAEIINALVRDTTVTFTSIEKTRDDISQAMSSTPGTYLVADVDDEVVGYASYGPFRAGPGYARAAEHSIALKTSSHRTGAGRALLMALERRARAASIHCLIAGVSGENLAGQAFHRALGYHVVGQISQVGRKFDRWLDLVLMQKFL
ncbi:MAG: GNAT family N-acetyltransferase [Marinovum sp.]|nr:GNAT family N-acetyltransferase [Marinovum sp.]